MKTLILIAAFLLLVPSMTAQSYQSPPPDLAALVDAPPTPSVSVGPSGEWMVLMASPSLPSIGELAEPELRLAGLRIKPRTNGSSRSGFYDGLTFKHIQDLEERPVSGLPENARIEDVQWSPDGTHLAFSVTLQDRIELWGADVETGEARRLSDRALNAAYYGSPFDWVSDSQTLIARTIPTDRGEVPVAPMAPGGPIVQENTEGAAPVRTYQDLLENPHDEALFRHYFTSQVVRIGLDGAEQEIGPAGIIAEATPAPGGEYVLVETIQEPFSYIVPAYRFPHTVAVWDLDGNLVKQIADLPLAENVPKGFGSVPTGVRSTAWRADAPASLYWTEALDGGDAQAEVEYRDQVYLLEAPFEAEPTPLAKLKLRYGGVSWSIEGPALVSEYWWSTRRARTYLLDPDAPEEEMQVVFDYSTEDRYNDPGDPMMQRTEQGTWVLHMADAGKTLFLSGDGASPEGDRPFLRKLDLETLETTEVFRSGEPVYENPITLLDDAGTSLLTRRETTTEPPNYFVRDLQQDADQASAIRQVTEFPHPYPELAGIQKEAITYEREDGLPLTANLYLPADYDAERDGPLPGLVWAYPVEYKDAGAAGQVTDSPYRFKSISYWGALPYVTQGYAVLDRTAMPVVGEGETEPNDRFREQLVANAKAAIEEGVRRGVLDPDRVAIGGHSYGAFMTGNLLAHSDLFRAGIARSGAYNRTLTPFGFQREERTFWEAPEIYFGMSPFMHAHKVNEPILLIHGKADNNSGTFPIQSERFYAALKGHGATARLVMLPHESHGYRARESVLHMLWEMNRWLDLHVKNAPPRETTEDTELPAQGGTQGNR